MQKKVYVFEGYVTSGNGGTRLKVHAADADMRRGLDEVLKRMSAVSQKHEAHARALSKKLNGLIEGAEDVWTHDRFFAAAPYPAFDESNDNQYGGYASIAITRNVDLY